jgi:asparaginyl-tRNA synthetase
MKHTKIIEVLQSDKLLQPVLVKGWVRSFRNDRFIAVNDGSIINNIQCVLEDNTIDAATQSRITVGAAVAITGTLIESQGKGQRVEIQISNVEIEGDADPEELKLTILSPKRHTLEKLREQAHLRVRTNTFGAIMRVRSKLSFAIHEYFQKNDFYYVHTPIITKSDAEGAGEAFKVTNLDLNNIPKNENGEVDYKEDFLVGKRI